VLGETLTGEPSELIGTAVKANLATLSGDLKQQSVTLTFTIVTADDKEAVALLTGYTLSNSALRRLTSRNIEKLADTLHCETGDGVALQVKMVLLTASSTHNSLLKALRKSANSAIMAEIKSKSYHEFARAVIDHQFQFALKKSLNKIYPLKAVEIRFFSIVSSPAASALPAAEAEQKEAPEEEKPQQEPRASKHSTAKNAEKSVQ
jgi:ribosomal protein S3AE